MATSSYQRNATPAEATYFEHLNEIRWRKGWTR